MSHYSRFQIEGNPLKKQLIFTVIYLVRFWQTGILGTSAEWPYYRVNKYLKEWRKRETLMKQKYRMHIQYVKTAIPSDKLLVWNVKGE